MDFQMNANKQSPTAVVNVMIQPRQAIVEYRGAITDEMVSELVKSVETLHHVYQPEKICIRINSPGGVITGLHYVAHNMEMWRKKGLVVETFADTQCGSAAAVMFTLGEVGSREAHPLSTLVFHQPRIIAPGFALLEHQLVDIGQRLKMSSEQMSHYLISHLKSSLGVQGFAKTLKARAEQLTDEGFLKECEHLSLYASTFVFSLVEMADEFKQWAQWDISDEQGAQALLTRWKENVKKLNDEDGRVDLRTAWGLLLIDSTDGLPAFCIRDFEPLENKPAQVELPTDDEHQPSSVSSKNRP